MTTPPAAEPSGDTTTSSDVLASRRRMLGAFGVALVGLPACAAAVDPVESSESPLSGTSTNIGWADTIADLRALRGRNRLEVMIVKGYYAPGDGGGGEFHWDPGATSDDGGLTIMPSGSTSPGGWRRLTGDSVDVRWFGARGDLSANDAPAFQSAVDAALRAGGTQPGAHGITVVVSPGNYLLTAPPGDAAVHISTGVRLVGSGTPPYGAAVLWIRGGGDGLRVEGSLARATAIQNLQLYSDDRSARDGVVVHTNHVVIQDCFIDSFHRYGVIIESGPVDSFISSTRMPSGTTANSNAWCLRSVFLGRCGDRSTPEITGGGGFYVHGSDTNGGVAIACFAQSNSIGYIDGSLSGATFLGCYSESDNIGFDGRSAGAPVLVGCHAESAEPFRLQGGATNTLVIGGGTVGSDVPIQRLGALRSRIAFSDRIPATSTEPEVNFRAEIPVAAHRAVLEFARDTGWWALAYEPVAPIYRYQEKSWQLYRWQNDGVVLDPYGSPFGFTDKDNPRGPALPFFSNPMMNSKRRWSWKQHNVTLALGENIVYLSGRAARGADDEFAQAATVATQFAETRVSIDIELGDEETLFAANLRVGAHAFLSQSTSGGQVAVKVHNEGQAVVVATLVWHFEAFVTNGYSVG